MQVVYAEPGLRLVMTGGLGPLQALGVSGAMVFELRPTQDGSVLDYRYSVSGYAPDGLNALAEPVDRVQLGQLHRLQAYLAAQHRLR